MTFPALIKFRSKADLPYDVPAPDNPYWDVDLFYGESDKPSERYANVHKLDFTVIKNESMRQEIMFWLFSAISKLELSKSRFNDHVTKAEVLISFLHIYRPDLISILEINAAEFIPLYETWLDKMGIANTPTHVKLINGEMKNVVYEYDGYYTIYFKRFYNYIADLCDPSTLLPEKDKDRWDIRNFPFKVKNVPSRPRYTVSFEKISQIWLKNLVKEYSYIRLRTKKMSTVVDDLKGFNLFSEFLSENNVVVRSAEEITRNNIEDYIVYVNNRDFAPTPHNQRIASVIRLFNFAMIQGEEVNCSKLFYGIDYARQVDLEPNYFTDNELRQINSCMDEYPELIRLFLILIQSIGGRISDVCQIKIKGCLTKNPKGEYSLHYIQQKTEYPRNIPIPVEIAGVVAKAIEVSQKSYGKDCVYVFAKSVDMPIAQDTVSRWLNIMSYKHHFVTDDGKPLRVQSHAFRRTKATRLAALGMNTHQIMIYLGQRTPSVLKRYINVYAIDDQDVLKPYLEDKNKKIAAIGVVEKKRPVLDSNAEIIPLFNGGCQRSWDMEPCERDGNFCFKCHMFVPNPLDLPIYIDQLERLNAKLTLAKMNDRKLVVPRLKEDINALEAVIQACKEK